MVSKRSQCSGPRSSAYDDYIRSLIVVRRLGTRYVSDKVIPGMHVLALMQRIAADLPERVGDLTSHHQAELKAVTRRRLDRQPACHPPHRRTATALEWTDWGLSIAGLGLGVIGGHRSS